MIFHNPIHLFSGSNLIEKSCNEIFYLGPSESLGSPIIEDNTEDNLIEQSCNEIFYLGPSLGEIYDKENFESTINLKKIESDKGDTKAKSIFISHKKRGRKPSGKTKIKKQNDPRYDNIKSQIQISFLSFLISFLNNCIHSFSLDENNLFLNFQHKEKSKSSSKYFNKLKNCSIKELIVNMNISDKYKRFEKDKNRKNLEELSKNDWFVKVFRLKYLDLFSFYYNNGQPLKKLSFFGKTVNFSEETKSFYDLLVKYEKSKEDIIKAAKMFFLNGENNLKSD